MIINLTPHDIFILNGEDRLVKVFASKGVVRLSQNTEVCEPIEGVRTTRTAFGEVMGLPQYKEGIYYIVSRLVKQARPKRPDLLVPNEIVRGSHGQIIGCKSLSVD